MNNRLRFLVIFLGAIVVGVTFTFPIWFPMTLDPEDIVLFPELPDNVREAFAALPEAQQQAYLALRDENVTLAANMAVYALQPQNRSPDEEQENPNRSGQVEVESGEFRELTPIRRAQGIVTLYQLPDGTRYLWLEDFAVVPGPELRLFLSSLTTAQFNTLMTDREPGDFVLSLDELLLDPLRYDAGNQSYEVPREADLSRYNSVLIYSTRYELLYSFAPF